MQSKIGFLIVALLTCAQGLHAADVILNEYNAVGNNQFLEDSASDTFWGRVEGNGGDWFELVVITDHLDMRGWTLTMSDSDAQVATLTLTDHAVWSDLRSGTILTVSEQWGDTADTYDPSLGNWWINVQAADSASGTYITASNFHVNNRNWQLTIANAAGGNVFGPAGEGIQPLSGVNNQEVCKLEEDPGPGITPQSGYFDGQSSTFGSPNIWSAGAASQDLSVLRSVTGECTVDEDCDDGNYCTGQATCAAGVCIGGAYPCLPGELCDENEDECVLCITDADCDNGDYCDGEEFCVEGRCFDGAAPCSGQMCDEGDNVCVDCLEDEECDDGDFCNGEETCETGSCQSGTEPCPGQLCDEASDTCADCLTNAECDDGDACTTDTCSDGTCQYAPVAGCIDVDDEPPPDADGDGVADDLDQCPDTSQAEAVDDQGCACSQLDDDADDIDNCLDQCPETPPGQTADANGCACGQLDEDEDGVDNCSDLCPNTPPGQEANLDGCACEQLDDDADGVNNCLDRCPGTLSPEDVDSNGCTCLQLSPDDDEDGDGVLDCFDECANTPAGNAVDGVGCSVVGEEQEPGAGLPDTDDPAAPADGDDDVAVPRGGGGGGSSCGAVGLLPLASLFALLAGASLARQRREPWGD